MKAPNDWFQHAFGDDYVARYALRDGAEARRAVALAASRVTLTAASVVFDLCCGAGRHLAAWEAVAPQVLLAGGDLSMPLLRLARSHRNAAGVARLDMRHLPLAPGSVDLVTSFFTSFGYFQSDAENFGVFAEIATALRPGGWYFLDVFNADRVRQLALDWPAQPVTQHDAAGRSWGVRRALTADGRRVMKQQWPGGADVAPDPVHTLWEDVALYDRATLETALTAAGLTVRECWGDYDGSAHGVDSPRTILLAQRLGAPRSAVA